MSRAEGIWLAYLWLCFAYEQDQQAAFRRAIFKAYGTPANQRLEAVAMRDSAFMRRIGGTG